MIFSNRQITLFFLFLVYLHSLAAYSLFGVPLQWLVSVSVIGLVFFLLSRGSVHIVPGTNLFLSLFIWGLMITLYKVIFYADPSLLPKGSTTGFLPYIGLRFLNIVVFSCVVYIVYYVGRKGHGDFLIKSLVNIGVAVALSAVYIYFAQLYGWPEPSRSRLGTSGGEQHTVFTYAFHRALGTFREPSHLAQWLVLPLCLSFIGEPKKNALKTLSISVALILTGSLTGIGGVLVGLCLAFLIMPKTNVSVLKSLGRVVVPCFAVVFLLVFVSLSKSGELSYLEVLWDRVEPMLFGEGVEDSNRGYVYHYFSGKALSWWGEGFGMSNLTFAHQLGVSVVASFLSLYLNYLVSTGWVGVTLLMLFLLYPIFLVYVNRNKLNSEKGVFLLMAYGAWLFMFAGHAEELSVGFGVSYALVVLMVKEVQKKPSHSGGYSF